MRPFSFLSRCASCFPLPLLSLQTAFHKCSISVAVRPPLIDCYTFGGHKCSSPLPRARLRDERGRPGHGCRGIGVNRRDARAGCPSGFRGGVHGRKATSNFFFPRRPACRRFVSQFHPRTPSSATPPGSGRGKNLCRGGPYTPF